jgi:4-amino-4-deoxy-L-arabinose transferase-like glycosyltransferase
MAAGRFPRGFVLTAALAGLAARLAFGLFYWVGEPLNRDEVEYLSLARNLAAGRGYDFDEYVKQGPVTPFGRAPGYPVFLALTGGGTNSFAALPVSVKIAQAVAGGAGVLLIALAAFRLGGRRAAIAAAAIAAVHPPLTWIAGFAYSEAVFWPLGLALAIVTSRMLETRTSGWPLALGVGTLAGVAILVRAATLLFVPIAIAWMLWKRQPRTAAVFLAGLALVLGPWTARNVAVHGRFVLVASDGGVTLWTGNNALATGEGDMAANPHLKLANQALRAAHPGLTEEELEPIYYQESVGWMIDHPFAFAWLVVKKAFYTVVPIGPSYRLHSTKYYLASVMTLAALVPLAIYGAWRLGAARARLAGMWLLAAAAFATCLVFFPQERFRIPVLDPALILLASGAFVRAGDDAADEAVIQRVA